MPFLPPGSIPTRWVLTPQAWQQEGDLTGMGTIQYWIASVPLAANSVYKIRAVVIYRSSAVGDLKVAFDVPAGVRLWAVAEHLNSADAPAVSVIEDQPGVGFVCGGGGLTTTRMAVVRGTVTTGSSTGWVELTAGQVTYDDPGATVRDGSYLCATLVD